MSHADHQEREEHEHAGHHHDISDGGFNENRAFAIGIGLNMVMVLAELAAGFFAGSMALVADAGHNFSDVIGIVMAWGASWLSRQAAPLRFTWGYRRSTILAAVASGLLLLLATAGIVWESIQRIFNPGEVAGAWVIAVAALGIGVNGFTAYLFLAGSQRDLNIRGAFLHLIGDAAVSLGVVISGILIFFLGWNWLDPIVSLLIAGAILWATWGLMRDSIAMALDAVPHGIDMTQIHATLAGLNGVRSVHDLHVWPVSTTETALSVHLVMPAGASDQFLAETSKLLKSKFTIGHCTLQIETGDPAFVCDLCSLEADRLKKVGGASTT
jgi:cobalt-zinc-cadmium efflux system protein